MIKKLVIRWHDERARQLSGVFQLEYSESFVNVSTVDIADDTLSSECLPKTTCTAYIWYIQVGKLCLKKNKLLRHLARLSVNVRSAESLCISHIDSLVLNSLETGEVETMIETAD